MNWSTFIFWWLEWPLKVAVTGILVVALLLFLNNIILLIFRSVAMFKGKAGYQRYNYGKSRMALKGQFGPDGRFHHLFKWYGWFWFKRS